MWYTDVYRLLMWSYTDVYHSLVDYVSQDLRDGAFKLNWGIVAIAELTPRVIVHFTLQNVNTSKTLKDNCSGSKTFYLLGINWVNRYKFKLV